MIRQGFYIEQDETTARIGVYEITDEFMTIQSMNDNVFNNETEVKYLIEGLG